VRRIALRQLRADDGLSLVETVAALLVFSLIMTGLAAAMTMFVHSTGLTKARNSASALAQRLLEQDRAIGLADLETCTTGAPSGNQPFKGNNYPVLTSSGSNCIPYQTSMTANGYTFTVKTLVLNAGTGNDVAGTPQVDKYVQIILTWTTPTSGTYELDSAVNNQGNIAADPAQGVVFDPRDSSGNSLTTQAFNWDYTVLDSGSNVVASGQTEEGGQPLVNLATGTYTCIAAVNASSSTSYVAGTNTGYTIGANGNGYQQVSGTCTVSAGAVGTWVTVWSPITSCASSTTKGSLNVKVVDQNGIIVSGATVALTNANTQAAGPSATSNSSGVAVFNNKVNADLYTYGISLNGSSNSGQGPVCVTAGGLTNAQGTIQTSACPSVTGKGSVQFTVQNGSGAPLANATIALLNQSGKANPATVKSNAQGVALFNNTVTGDLYLYNVNAPTGYTDQNNQGPLCATAGTTYKLTITVFAQGTGCVANGNTNDIVVIQVQDPAGNPLNGVKVTMVNADGNQGNVQATSGADGDATFTNNLKGDWYYFTVTPPANYLNPGASTTFCVPVGASKAASVTTSQPAVLQGTMTVKVSVTNQDTEPTKTYNIILTDSSGNQTTQSTTANKTKTSTTTFTSMPTDSYSIVWCVLNAQSGNCDALSSTSGSFLTVGATNTAAYTDTSADKA
jgi:Na+-translocating ferredoxin:NAD+ oxidoreductase RnfG subunit